MPEFWTVNSDQSKTAFYKFVDELYEQNKYLTFEWRIGADRSLTQNALLHVWITEWCSFLIKCHKSEVTEGMIEGAKRTLKGLFYGETKEKWMVHKVICPLTKREKTDYTSSTSWKHGEMFMFLTWFQNFAAFNGLVLEAKGEFLKLARKQNK